MSIPNGYGSLKRQHVHSSDLISYVITSYSMISNATNDAQLKQLQRDLATFTEDIAPEEKQTFEEWLAGFSLEERTNDISALLNSNEQIGKIHAQLGTQAQALAFQITYSGFV
eukprot:GEZU01019071.1.p1 GENE.GEZU01019071.1~~GEZU01019071.1.p1  ORF type:complete len:113 (+),score=2.70 GEZU01019071.1:237-575(+)